MGICIWKRKQHNLHIIWLKYIYNNNCVQFNNYWATMTDYQTCHILCKKKWPTSHSPFHQYRSMVLWHENWMWPFLLKELATWLVEVVLHPSETVSFFQSVHHKLSLFLDPAGHHWRLLNLVLSRPLFIMPLFLSNRINLIDIQMCGEVCTPFFPVLIIGSESACCNYWSQFVK